MKTQRNRVYVYLALVGVIGGALTIRQVWAVGLSASPGVAGLTYSGRLEDENGKPLTGTQNIQVSFWPSSTAVGQALCQSAASAAAVTVGPDGHFELPPLPETCASAFRNNSTVFAEVTVQGTPLARTKVGTVPFAVSAIDATQAATATNATNATTATTATNGAFRVDTSGATPVLKNAKVCAGTTAGNTTWSAVNTTLITTTVDITKCTFTTAPIITTSLGGDAAHWLTTGGSQPFSITNTGFKVNVANPDTTTLLATANTNKWYVNWIAVGN